MGVNFSILNSNMGITTWIYAHDLIHDGSKSNVAIACV